MMENLGRHPRVVADEERKEAAHKCKLPSFMAHDRRDRVAEGDILKCPECGQHWRCDNFVLDRYARVGQKWLRKHRPDLADRPRRSLKLRLAKR
jgi:hypothetical protein